MSRIDINNAQISYKDDGKIILDIPSLTITNGINFIIGDNGSGKSTFLKAISNYFQEIGFEGIVEINGKPIKNKRVGLVNQSPINSISPNLTFLENMLLARFKKRDFLKFQPMKTKREKIKIREFLEYFNIKNKVEKLLQIEAFKLSAGQQQLLAILMRLFRFKDIILLDEATANLDTINTKIIFGMLLEISKKGTIVIFATHQMKLLETEGAKIYKTDNGTIFKYK